MRGSGLLVVCQLSAITCLTNTPVVETVFVEKSCAPESPLLFCEHSMAAGDLGVSGVNRVHGFLLLETLASVPAAEMYRNGAAIRKVSDAVARYESLNVRSFSEVVLGWVEGWRSCGVSVAASAVTV